MIDRCALVATVLGCVVTAPLTGCTQAPTNAAEAKRPSTATKETAPAPLVTDVVPATATTVAYSIRRSDVVPRVARIITIGHFEASSFCEEYGCGDRHSYFVKDETDGSTLTTYKLTLANTSMEEGMKGANLAWISLGMFDREQLGESDFHAIESLLRSLDSATSSADVMRHVRATVETSVEKIREAQPTRFGRYQVWAGKVGNHVVSAHLSSTLPKLAPPP
jgi:hypothetical protein